MLASGAAALASSSDSPRTDAALLLAHCLQRSREWVAAHADAALSPAQTVAFEALCARRCTGVPVAYLLGTANFYGREFVVNEHVLVPRPETEHLVDEAKKIIRAPMRVLDVGTGCGAIACTIAAETQVNVDATDACPHAIELASENARRLAVDERCAFYGGDLVEPVRGKRYDVVIANLPYIPTADLPRPSNPAAFEPRAALDGGPDGLALYRRLMPSLTQLINERAVLLFEAAPPTIRDLEKVVSATLPNFVISIGKDYSGLDRYVKAISP